MQRDSRGAFLKGRGRRIFSRASTSGYESIRFNCEFRLASLIVDDMENKWTDMYILFMAAEEGRELFTSLPYQGNSQ